MQAPVQFAASGILTSCRERSPRIAKDFEFAGTESLTTKDRTTRGFCNFLLSTKDLNRASYLVRSSLFNYSFQFDHESPNMRRLIDVMIEL